MKQLSITITLLICVQILAQEITTKKINASIEKGIQFILKKQNRDGFWEGSHSDNYPMGKTALIVYTLIKSGVSPEKETIKKAFKYLNKLPFRKVYSVSLYIMAVEAKFGALGKKLSTKKQKLLKKRNFHPFRALASSKEQRRMVKAAKFLSTSTSNGLWGYPDGTGDLSNTQYALLGLFATERLGLPVDKKIYYKVVRHFIKVQEKDGPQIKRPFIVPAADQPIDWQWRQKLEKDIAKLKNKNSINKLYPRSSTTVVSMKARGWKYRENHGKVSGSMTTAGVACMVISKAYLEKWRSSKWKKLLPKINESIRDGCAWIAHNFEINKNPNGGHLYYYLYGLERAGILSGVKNFASHNWYLEGARKMLKDQKKDGRFKNEVDTCFALLFLKRATVPVRLETKMEK
ncbi:prenyltransferase/squalene oxidase repeat-containing protein [Candidatus Uabimicrobium sp. HlEnr_7]|uniref:prenyltransferase/squalene oxidase repeat-containing protein n=1 Tax=Candidatus Uabimicrobium helgolandensis TaxID=3095367 RepID=UPI003557A17F